MSRLGTAVMTVYDVKDGDSPVYSRYYSTYPGLHSEMGDPDDGVNLTAVSPSYWTLASGSVPDTAYWIAERYTISGGTPSAWQLLPVQAKDSGLPFVTGNKAGYNKPTLGGSTWITDAVAAVSAFTGRSYSNQKEFGYGTTVVIEYDDGKLSGRYIYDTSTNPNSDTWVAPASFIDGDLIVDGSISADQIAANTITATEILADTITATEIVSGTITADEIATGTITSGKIAAGAITATEIASGTITATEISTGAITADKINVNGTININNTTGALAWGKSSGTDYATNGMYFGHNGSTPVFMLGNASSFLKFDGTTITGTAVGVDTGYTPGTSTWTTVGSHTVTIAASVASFDVKLMSGGGGGGVAGDDWVSPQATAGGLTRVRHYNVSNVLQGTYSSTVGTAGGSNQGTGVTTTGANFSDQGNGFVGTGGTGVVDEGSWNFRSGSASGYGAGGGGHGYLHSKHSGYYGQGGGASTVHTSSTITVATGDYLIIDVGAGGSGATGNNGQPYWFGPGIYHRGGAGSQGQARVTFNV